MHDSTQQRQQPPSSPIPLSSSSMTSRPLPPWPVSPQDATHARTQTQTITTNIASPRAHERRECPGAPVKPRKSRVFEERPLESDGSNLSVRPRRLFFDDIDFDINGYCRDRSDAEERTACTVGSNSNDDDDNTDDGNRHFCHYAIESPPSSPCLFRRRAGLAATVTPTPAATVLSVASTTPTIPTSGTGRIISPHRNNSVRDLERARGASLSLSPGRGLFAGRIRSVSTNSNDDDDLQEMSEQL